MAAVTLLQKWTLLQAIIATPGLTATAKVVAARMLDFYNTQTGRCCPSYQTLAEGTALKRRAIIYAVQELEAGGWIAVDRVKGGASTGSRRYSTNAFRVDFSRVEPTSATVHDDAPSTVHGGALSQDDNSAPDDTTTVHGGAPLRVHGGAPESGKNTGKGNREESPIPPSAFDEWWEAYPRKVGKDAARPVFDRVLKAGKASVTDLIAAAERYAAERAEQDPQFTKHPKTWLNGGHWADEPPSRAWPQSNGRRAYSALERLMEETDNGD